MKKIAKILAIAIVAVMLASCNSPVKVLDKGIKDAKAATTMEELEKVNNQVAEKMKKFDEAEFKNDTAFQNRAIEYFGVIIQKNKELRGTSISDFLENYAEETTDTMDDMMDEFDDAMDELDDAMDVD